MLIITERNHNVSPARHAIQDISGSWSHFLFFPSGDKPRGDTISMSRSLKAVINSVMDEVFFLQSFAYDVMELCCVYFSKVNYKDITQKVEHINWKMRKLRENCRVLLFIKTSWNYRFCLNPACEAQLLWQGKCKVLERCLQISSLCTSTLSFDFEHAEKKQPSSSSSSSSSDNTFPMCHLTFGDFPFSLIIHCLVHIN